jgi:hypothetical protein
MLFAQQGTLLWDIMGIHGSQWERQFLNPETIHNGTDISQEKSKKLQRLLNDYRKDSKLRFEQ